MLIKVCIFTLLLVESCYKHMSWTLVTSCSTSYVPLCKHGSYMADPDLVNRQGQSQGHRGIHFRQSQPCSDTAILLHAAALRNRRYRHTASASPDTNQCPWHSQLFDCQHSRPCNHHNDVYPGCEQSIWRCVMMNDVTIFCVQTKVVFQSTWCVNKTT